MQLKELNQLTENLNASVRMPVLFVGHGSPMTLKGKTRSSVPSAIT